MLRRIGDILIVVATLALGILLWRGRMIDTPSAEVIDRRNLAREEIARIDQMETIGGAPITPDFIRRECAASARLAIAEYDCATSQLARRQALLGHLQRMNNRVNAFQHIIWEEGNPTTLLNQVDLNVSVARLWVILFGS